MAIQSWWWAVFISCGREEHTNYQRTTIARKRRFDIPTGKDIGSSYSYAFELHLITKTRFKEGKKLSFKKKMLSENPKSYLFSEEKEKKKVAI